MIRMIASKYHNRYCGKYDLEDLKQAARLGVLDAHRMFDETKNNKFITLAYNYARFGISRMLRSDTGTIKVPTKLPTGVQPPTVVRLNQAADWDRLAVEQEDCEALHRRVILEGSLGRLKPLQARILRMLYLEEMSAAEAARALGVATNTVYAHQRRALEQLRRHLADEGVDSWDTI